MSKPEGREAAGPRAAGAAGGPGRAASAGGPEAERGTGMSGLEGHGARAGESRERRADGTRRRPDAAPPAGRGTPARGRVVHPIEARSYEILRSRVDLGGLPPLRRAVAERVIHASADLEYATDLVADEAGLERGLAALRAGAPVVTDVAMVAAGITRRRAVCSIGDPAAARTAAATGLTRSAAAVRVSYARVGPGAVWVVGCAPTALEEIIAFGVEPALVIGLPVGFVGAAESKAALRASGLPAVSNVSEKGGSAVAAAALNALLYHADDLAPGGVAGSPLTRAGASQEDGVAGVAHVRADVPYEGGVARVTRARAGVPEEGGGFAGAADVREDGTVQGGVAGVTDAWADVSEGGGVAGAAGARPGGRGAAPRAAGGSDRRRERRTHGRRAAGATGLDDAPGRRDRRPASEDEEEA